MSLKNPLSDPLYDCIFTVEGAGLTKEQKSVEVYVLGAQVLGRRRLELTTKTPEHFPRATG